MREFKTQKVTQGQRKLQEAFKAGKVVLRYIGKNSEDKEIWSPVIHSTFAGDLSNYKIVG